MIRRTKLLIAAYVMLVVLLGQAHGEIAASARPAASVAVISMILNSSSDAAAKLTWKERQETVRYQTWQPQYWALGEVIQSVRWAAHNYGIDASRMQCIAYRESHYEHDAYNSASGASGVMQHLRRYWAGRRAAYRAQAISRLQIKAHVGPFSARANVLVAAWMIRRHGWGAWAGQGCG